MLQKHYAKQPWMSTPCTFLSQMIHSQVWDAITVLLLLLNRQAGLFDVVVAEEPVGWSNELSKI